MNRRDFIAGAVAGIGVLAGGTALYVNQPKFGRAPSGSRMERILKSPNYKDGHFENLVPVKMINEETGKSRFSSTWDFLFGDKTGFVPQDVMLTKKIDLKTLNVEKDSVIWIGHSTIYLQLAGKRILVDPVFSDYGSPIFFINKAFKGSSPYQAGDFPDIDVLAITHDHWDHLDYPSVMALKDKVKAVVCPLGVGEYFEQWGFDMESVHEEDWNTEIKIDSELSVHVLPSQHFSGRFLKQNQTQWCGFAFITPKRRVFLSGDGGYGPHFKDIGQKFGGFDLAIMENGQYNIAWHAIHMLPDETAQAAEDVGAKFVIPMHGGKFALAMHIWQEPYRELTRESAGRNYALITPENGEIAFLDELRPGMFDQWWERMQ